MTWIRSSGATTWSATSTSRPSSATTRRRSPPASIPARGRSSGTSSGFPGRGRQGGAAGDRMERGEPPVTVLGRAERRQACRGRPALRRLRLPAGAPGEPREADSLRADESASLQVDSRRRRRPAAVEPRVQGEGISPERQVVGRQPGQGERALVPVAAAEGIGPGAEVRLRALTRMFGSVVAVSDVSLTIAAASFFTLLGPSGSGKTTTLMMVAGFVHPTRGQIAIDGVDVTALPPQKRDLGMVFQSYAVFPHLTVFENVAFPLQVRKI